MKALKKTTVIVFLCISLFFSGVLSYLSIFIESKNLELIIENIDIIKIIKDDKDIEKVLENKKIPIEVLENIDKEEVVKMFSTFIRKQEIDEEYISNIYKESINKYEILNDEIVYDNIKEEVDEITTITVGKFKELLDTYVTIYNFVWIRFIFYLLSVLLTIALLLKKNIFELGLTYSILSIFIYYILQNSSRNIFAVILNDNINKLISSNLTKTCIIYLCIGIILLVIYFIFVGKQTYKKIKNAYIDSYWRYR